MLAYYMPEQEVMLTFDYSPNGIRVVLAHWWPNGVECLTALASQTWADTERKFAWIEKEGLVVIFDSSVPFIIYWTSPHATTGVGSSRVADGVKILHQVKPDIPRPGGGTIHIHTRLDQRKDVVNNQHSDWSFKVDGILHNAPQDVVYKAVAKNVVSSTINGFSITLNVPTISKLILFLDKSDPRMESGL
eukprot:g43999.t1